MTTRGHRERRQSPSVKMKNQVESGNMSPSAFSLISAAGMLCLLRYEGSRTVSSPRPNVDGPLFCRMTSTSGCSMSPAGTSPMVRTYPSPEPRLEGHFINGMQDMASSAMLNFVLIVMGMAPKSTGSIQLCFFFLGGGRVSLVCGYSAGLHVQQGVVWLWTFCHNDRGWKERVPLYFPHLLIFIANSL